MARTMYFFPLALGSVPVTAIGEVADEISAVRQHMGIAGSKTFDARGANKNATSLHRSIYGRTECNGVFLLRL